MYEELIKRLRNCTSDTVEDCAGCPYQGGYKGTYCMNGLISEAADAIEELDMKLHGANAAIAGMKREIERMVIDSANSKPQWIPVTERLPECEQEVLICTEKKLVGKDAYIDSIVTPAIYEDGTMPECDSRWHWEDIDYAGWDEEEDCGIIPEGWWENRHFNPDDVYNNPVDRKVIAWMPLPEPPKEE